MNELQDMTPEELEAILGTDYETVIADALRRKEGAEADPSPNRAAGQLANGHVYFDPGYAIEKYANRVRQSKDKSSAQGDLDKALEGQKAGRRTYAQVLTRGPQGPAPVPMAQQDPNAGPTRAPAPPAPPAPPPAPAMAPPPPSPPTPPAPPSPPAGLGPTAGPLGPVPSGEPLRGPPKPGMARPPLANASTMDPSALQGAGVPLDVQELLRQLRGQ